MKLFDILLESRVDFLKDKYVPLLDKKFHYDMDYFTIIQQEIDPTNNKIYLQWLLNRVLEFTGQRDLITFTFEDAYKWKEYLTIYDKVKSKLPIEQRDINKLSLDQLKNIALEYKEKEEEILTKNDYLDKKYKIKETDAFNIYMFKTSTEQDFKMYQLISTNTEWCTRPRYNTFKNYIDESPLFVFINKQNRNLKYQYHITTSQFMDQTDNNVDSNIVANLLKALFSHVKLDSGRLMIKVKPDTIKKKKKFLGVSYNESLPFNKILFNFDTKEISYLTYSDNNDGHAQDYINDVFYAKVLNGETINKVLKFF